VRVRPLAAHEDGPPAAEVQGRSDVLLREPCAADDYLARLRCKERRWAFDAAFGPACSQQQVYAASAAPLVAEVAEGRNATCFCYGATGAGKTHTMLGSAESPGVMVQALADLFHRVPAAEAGARIRLAYLEIYNENVRDLLANSEAEGAASAAGLELREDPLVGVTVAGLTYAAAASAGEVLALLQRGNALRVTEPTRCNAVSSRSHAVLQVLVERPARFAGVAKLSLIDLAGSERALATEARSARSAEGAAINKSLLALSSCIHALVEGRRHVPYRNSRLTQLLKDSLGGGCRTAMIANVSPAPAVCGESANTLHWADRAKEIRNGAQPHGPAAAAAAPAPGAADAAALVTALREEVSALRASLAAERAEAERSVRRRTSAGGAYLDGDAPLPSSSSPVERRRAVAAARGLAASAPGQPSIAPGRDALLDEVRSLRSALAQSRADASALAAALAAAHAEAAGAREAAAEAAEAAAARAAAEAAAARMAAAAAAAAPPLSPRACFVELPNGGGCSVKKAAASIEQRAGSAAGGSCPVAPSPGRILNSQLFQRFQGRRMSTIGA